MDKAFSKKMINKDLFDFSPNKFLIKLKTSKLDFEKIDLSLGKPSIFLCFNITIYSKLLVSASLNSKHVFIKDDIINKIASKTISTKEKEQLLEQINLLSQNGFLIVIMVGETPSMFGENHTIAESLTEFLFDTKLDIKYLTFPGEYFSFPFWSNNLRKCKTYACQQVTVTHNFLIGLTKKEIYKYLNYQVPSTATIYSYKYPLKIKSNNLAVGLEKLIYCCPNCKSFFSIYSEFSCIKCKKCSKAIEISNDGQILFSKYIKTFDEIQPFLYKTLTKKGFDINEIISYNNIIYKKNINEPAKQSKIVKLTIFAEKFCIDKQSYSIADLVSVKLTFNNTLIIETKKEKFFLQGTGNENLYILLDLFKINKNSSE